MADLPPLIGRYEVISRLGQGGMGSLYLAKDPKIGRLVAIKLVRQEFDTPEARQRFAREAQSAGALRHPNIVTIFDVDEHERLPFIAMEYVDGETLSEIVRRRAPLALPKRLRWIEDLCAGLAYAHRQGVVHRDIKPANLMLDAEGTLKILDFGLARRETTKFTLSQTIIGTPNYMSPEQIRAGEIGPRSDIFAVGAVLYEVIAYKEAFPGTMHQAMHTILYEQPKPLEDLLPHVDQSLTAIVTRALEKDPDRRYQDLAVMRADLAGVRQRLEAQVEDSAKTMPMPRGGEGRNRDAVGAPDPGSAGRQTPPSGGSRRIGTHRATLQKRRVAQIETHLTEARTHFESGDLEKARDSCEQALMFDTEHPTGLQLMDEIAAEEERRQIGALVAAARAELQRGQLDAAERIVTEALQIAPQAPDVVQLLETIETTRRELERARQVQETLRRARARLAEGAFEVASRTAGEVLALDPENTAARDLQARAAEAIEAREQRAARDAAAQTTVSEARTLFESGDRAGAFAKLEAFSPPHDLVSAFLASLRGEHVEENGEGDAARQGGQRTERLAVGPATEQFMPGRSDSGPHVRVGSSRRALYVALAAVALVILAVVSALQFMRSSEVVPNEPPTNATANLPANPDVAASPTTAPSTTSAVIAPPASLTSQPPENQTDRDLLDAYRALAQGRRADAERIAGQIRTREPRHVELGRLMTAIRQATDLEKQRAAAALPPTSPSSQAAGSPSGSLSTPGPATTAPGPAVDGGVPSPPPASPKPSEPDPIFTVLPGGGFVAPSEPVPPPQLAELEKPGIEASIREYEKALSNKNLQAVSRVRRYTQAEAQNWRKAFDQFREYRLIVKIVSEPVVEKDRATIQVEETVAQTSKNGIQVFTQPRRVDYKLEKIAGKWMLLPPG